jgi:hypothetical protein
MPPSQGWRTFLRNHADGIASMDLFLVPTISFRLSGAPERRLPARSRQLPCRHLPTRISGDEQQYGAAAVWAAKVQARRRQFGCQGG